MAEPLDETGEWDRRPRPQYLDHGYAETYADVEKAAAILDEKSPGWEQRIDLAKLDIDDCLTCIMGQVYGNYSNPSRMLLGLRKGEENSDLDYCFLGFAHVEECWTELIKRRYDTGVFSDSPDPITNQ